MYTFYLLFITTLLLNMLNNLSGKQVLNLLKGFNTLSCGMFINTNWFLNLIMKYSMVVVLDEEVVNEH
jgi:hypothetical protein